MDDLLGIGPSEIGVTAKPAPQYRSRREAREASARSASAPTGSSQSGSAQSGSAQSGSTQAGGSRRLRRAEAALVRASAPRPARKNPIRALVTMSIVGGLFGVAGLPAYAVSNTAADASPTGAVGQSIVVSADAAVVSTSRDMYRATSVEQMAEMSRDDIRAQNNADYLLSGARQLGDDYPWFYELSEDQSAALSPLNYYYRQCTDFVAWRLNRDAGSYDAPYKWVWSNLTPTGGNASQWEYAWEQHGWPVSKTPIVGSVAWFGWSNHVAYVKAVNPDGTILIEEYNFVPNVYGQRTIPVSSVESFLYPPTN